MDDETRPGMSVAQILKLVLLLLALALFGWLVYTIRSTLLPFGIAFVLSYILMPLVDRMEARGLNRMVGVLVIYAATLLFFVLSTITFVPTFLEGLADMKDRIVGRYAEWPCVLANRGDTSVQFERIEIESSHPGDFEILAPPLPLDLPPGEMDTLTVRFAPSDTSFRTAWVHLHVLSEPSEAGAVGIYLTGNNWAGGSDPPAEAVYAVAVGGATVAFSDSVYNFGPIAPGYLKRIQAQIKDLQPQLEASLPMLKGVDLAELINERINRAGTELLKETPALVGSLISGITFVVIVPFVVFFFLSEGRAIKRAFIEIIPNPYFEMVLNLIYRIDAQLGGYIRGLVMSVAIISLLSVTGLRIIGLRDYLVVGVLAGLANVIPYLGPIIGIVAGVIAAVLQYSALSAAIPVVVVFLIVQIMDNVFVSPIVVARSVNLHPLVVIFVVLVGNQLFGAVGMLLAVPATAVAKVSAQTIYEGLRSYSVK